MCGLFKGLRVYGPMGNIENTEWNSNPSCFEYSTHLASRGHNECKWGNKGQLPMIVVEI